MLKRKAPSDSGHVRRSDGQTWPTHLSVLSSESVRVMTQNYVIVRKKTPKPEGGYWEQFELGLSDLNSWGDDHFDLAGYPYPDEVHAFVDDWLNLGIDFASTVRKMDEIARLHNEQGAGVPDGEGVSEGRTTPEVFASR
jgi:hypothetical protein